jgi:nucleoside-diphosphate kinase
VYSRQFKVLKYADEFTRKAFHSQEVGGQNLERAFVLIKPDAYMSLGRIIEMIEAAGFKISNLKMTRLN